MDASFDRVKLFGNGDEHSRNVEERLKQVFNDPTCVVGMQD